jgi:hypothetical protein
VFFLPFSTDDKIMTLEMSHFVLGSWQDIGRVDCWQWSEGLPNKRTRLSFQKVQGNPWQPPESNPFHVL